MTVSLPWFQVKLVKPCISRTPELNHSNNVKKDNHSLWKYFDDKCLTVQDLPKAIICHELLGVLIMALTWSACYYFPPSQNILLKQPIARLTSVLPRTLTEQINSNPFLNSRLGSSYLESSCVRRLIRPVALPAKLYLTYRMVRATPNIKIINTGQSTELLSDEQSLSTESLPSQYIQGTSGSGKGNSNIERGRKSSRFRTAAWLRGGYSGSSSSSSSSSTGAASSTVDILQAADLYRSYYADIHIHNNNNHNIYTDQCSRSIATIHGAYCCNTGLQPCRSVQYRLRKDTSAQLADSV